MSFIGTTTYVLFSFLCDCCCRLLPDLLVLPQAIALERIHSLVRSAHCTDNQDACDDFAPYIHRLIATLASFSTLPRIALTGCAVSYPVVPRGQHVFESRSPEVCRQSRFSHLTAVASA